MKLNYEIKFPLEFARNGVFWIQDMDGRVLHGNLADYCKLIDAGCLKTFEYT